ncbi:MAG: hypothetical protein Q4F70_02555, partial [Clostridia bacterium]|nr:hypothetical protein [Clostridia bacterium]
VFNSSGFSDEDIDKISKVDGVDKVEGLNYYFQFFENDGVLNQAKIISITDEIDKLNLKEGKLPTGSGEAALEKHYADVNGYKVGDVIKFNDVQVLTTEEVKITALVESPVYTSIYATSYGYAFDNSAPINCLVFVPEETFNEVVFKDYTDLVIISDELSKYSTNADEYKDGAKALKARVEDALDNSSDICVMTREYNGAYLIADAVKIILSKVRYTMATLFIIVGLLVCYSAVSRMVYEKSVLIGTKKALGLFDREIKLSELSFTSIAAILGSILGILLGRFAIETAVVDIILGEYTYNEVVAYSSIEDSLLIVALELIAIIVTTLFACNKVLKKTAVKLLQGAEPPKAKERFFERFGFWKRLSLLNKTIINNCLNDKRRCFATIVGVMGCVSLVVCAFTMYNGINSGIERQFADITTFDTMIYIDSNVEDCADNIASILDDNSLEYSEVYYQPGAINLPNDKQMVTSLMVPLDDSFYNYIHMIDDDGVEGKIESDAWVSKSYAYYFDSKSGDTIKFVDTVGTTHKFKIESAAESYQTVINIYVNKDAFEESFGLPAETNTFVLKRGDFSIAELTSLIKEEDGFIAIQDYYGDMTEEFSVYKLLSVVVVVVYMILSVVMAFLVLLNLLEMFVSEKKKELIVLMINGFYEKDAKKYIYQDTIVLTIIGMILGVVLGAVVGYETVLTMLTEASYFNLDPSIPAMVIGVGVTAVLVVITTLIALKRVSSFKLTDINSER